MYKWHLNATIISAEELGEALASRRRLEALMVAVSLLVVIAGLIIVVVAAKRERRLANLKSEFVANVSHELKTPLSSVRMFGELLQSGKVDSPTKQAQYLQIINREAERLSDLIENVLDFSRAERGKKAYDFVEGSVVEVVEQAVEVCRSRRGDVPIELRVEPNVPPARLDPRAVEVAVTNLIDNALKHAPQGKFVLVLVRSRKRAVEVAVTDQGAGISRADRKRIFDRFVRIRASDEPQVRGSGIGLALVKHIAEAHGGSISVQPAQPRGSTFVLSIPAAHRAK